MGADCLRFCARWISLLTHAALVSVSSLLMSLARLCSAVETREWVEELTSPSELHAASRANRAKLLSVQQTVDAAFQARDFGAMKLATIRLSFLTNIEEEIYKRLPVA